VTLKGQIRDPNTLRAQYLENYLSYRLQIWYVALYRECRLPSERTNNYPESGRGLGHVTLTIFGSTVGYPNDSLASCLLGEINEINIPPKNYSCSAPVFSSIQIRPTQHNNYSFTKRN